MTAERQGPVQIVVSGKTLVWILAFSLIGGCTSGIGAFVASLRVTERIQNQAHVQAVATDALVDDATSQRNKITEKLDSLLTLLRNEE